jgi:hypothetical protein
VIKIVWIITTALLILIIVLNLLRKFHWDAIHRNLLDLVDQIGGQVLRNGFLSRPIYHGEFQGVEITINFSNEKSATTGRFNLMDISLAARLNGTLTIASYNWLQTQEGKTVAEYEPLEIDGRIMYGIHRNASLQFQAKIHNGEFIHGLQSMHPFRFIFINQQGVLFEKELQYLPQETEHPHLKEAIDCLFQFINGLK